MRIWQDLFQIHVSDVRYRSYGSRDNYSVLGSKFDIKMNRARYSGFALYSLLVPPAFVLEMGSFPQFEVSSRRSLKPSRSSHS